MTRAPLLPLLARGDLVLAAGAHDALSAKLAEECGFDAIWASGFGISAVQGVPDANILTLTETLEAVRRIVDAVRIPVVADCDNGYGNAINVMRTVGEFERAGAAGVCIEDNDFPKRCSFYAGVRRDLVAVDEHARKIEAATAARRDPGFAVIARTEALIAVPTTYPTVGAAELAAAGFRMAIFANQALRAAIVAMRDALGEIRRSGQAESVEQRIASLEDVYALVGVSELKANEQRFLFTGSEPPRAVILAAGFEPQLMPLIQDRPKTMLEVKGRTILDRQVAALHGCGVRDVTVVRGYQKERVAAAGVRLVDNDRFGETGELYSLMRARDALGGAFLLLYGDIIFEPSILARLLASRADIAVVVDRAFHDAYRAGLAPTGGPFDLVVTETPPNGRRFVAPDGGSRILRIGPEVAPADAHGEFIGMAMFSATGAAALLRVHDELAGGRAEGLERASMTHILQALIDRGQPVSAVDIHQGWMEIDSFDDYRRAWAEVAR